MVQTLRPKQAAELFGISKHTIYAWICNGKLKKGQHYLKPGHIILILPEQFMNFLKEMSNSDSAS